MTKSVIFDFDYTLADSSAGVIECACYALNEMKLKTPDSDVICRTIGLSLADTFKSLSGFDDAVRAEEFSRAFTYMADQIMLERCVIYESVKPTLEALSNIGISMGIVSTKFHYRIEAFLNRECIREEFEVIVGGEDVSAHKPDPSGLLMAVRKLKTTPPETIYVGDSWIDAETAARATIPFVAVLTGVTHANEFNSYAPYATLADLRMLPILVA